MQSTDTSRNYRLGLSIETRIILGVSLYFYAIWYGVQEVSRPGWNGIGIWLPGLPALAFLWLTAHNLKRFPLFISILLGPIVSMLAEVIHIEAASLSASGVFSWQSTNFTWFDYLRTTYVWAYFYLTWFFAYLLITQYFRFVHAARQAAYLRAENSRSQFKIMRFKLSPHFLFNTLNSISTLVLEKNNQAAEKMIGHLSRFLRFSLDMTPSTKVTVEEEFGLVREYVEIEKARFEDRLNLTYDIDSESAKFKLPNLIIQTVIEVIIKEDVLPSRQKRELTLAASDSSTGLRIAVSIFGATNLSLQNSLFADIQDRLADLYKDGEAQLSMMETGTGSDVILQFPKEL